MNGTDEHAADRTRPAGHVPPILVRHIERGILLEATGEFDLANAKELRSSLAQSLRDRPEVVLVDMTEVTFISSVGLSLLVEAHAVATPGTLRIVTGTVARRAIELTRLDQVLSVYSSIDEALASS